MSAFTTEDLFKIMRECAGEEEAVDLSSAAADQEFALLGYDSLALMEAISRVERGYGITLPEETLGDALTPAAFVAAVNTAIADRVPAAGAA
ncbi:actinorhodin polyketide synthase [Streptomyces dioscori]|uniref:Actinorhodin polyketide synthase n=1 Tax=Streptomyces dioscori TaxID=2109333 RepID=A0A2P8QB53_9ACTN|nr:acyl carrier protein [Streptomyces dioscori]PSM43485.1 actinorhodin polyketide synthase [Streptomyces dioscori]